MAKANGKFQKSEAKPPFWLPILALVLILGGAMIFLYPTLSNLYIEHHQATIIQDYEEAVAVIDEALLRQAREDAVIYNENLMGNPVHDPFVPGSGYVLPDNYLEVLNLAQDGVMAYILIPDISVRLPIYHGTSEDVLEKGVGHIQQTALPIGGEGTHAVLTGHRGLASAELFTRLDEMEIGDTFYISVLDEVLAYEVKQITTVLPYELEDLAAIDGEDLVTLVTCTPYGVNTHRLLVQGSRIAYTEEIQEDVSEVIFEQQERDTAGQILGVVIGLLILIPIPIILYLRGRKTGRKKKA